MRIFIESVATYKRSYSTNSQLDEVVCDMIEQYWQEGDPKTDANYLYASVRDKFIHRSPPMHGMKRLLKAWIAKSCRLRRGHFHRK